MRTIQEIFNHVIARGFYTNGAIDYMCNSLFLATSFAITRVEREFALNEINVYIESLQPNSDAPLYATMLEAAYPCDVDGSFEVANRVRREVDIIRGRHGIVMGIYCDWDNRPKNADEIRAIIESVLNNHDE